MIKDTRFHTLHSLRNWCARPLAVTLVTSTVSMGTGVMIGAGISALTGRVEELAGAWFPFAFLAAALVAGFSAYSYVRLSNAYPSAGGIAMFLKQAYSKSTMTGACALMMYFSMVINESLVARTFGNYGLQPFGENHAQWLAPALGVGLLAFAFLVNILSNQFIQTFSFIVAFVKIADLIILAAGGLWASGLTFESVSAVPNETGVGGFLGAVALGILAYKGFTTITNSGGEIQEPYRNSDSAIRIFHGPSILLMDSGEVRRKSDLLRRLDRRERPPHRGRCPGAT